MCACGEDVEGCVAWDGDFSIVVAQDVGIARGCVLRDDVGRWE